MINAFQVSNAHPMMTRAALPEQGIEVGFADGCMGLIPYTDVPEIGARAAVSSLEMPNPYRMVLQTARGERVEIPWDFTRHYCDATYRPTVEAMAMRGRRTVGARIRRIRQAAGFTRDHLARAADIGRVTLVRLERGEQTPRLRTLDAIVTALDVSVRELLVEP